MNRTRVLSDQIHDDILEMVIAAGAESDSVLYTERELVERFQVSKAPVREALLKLCNEGVLNSIPRVGYVIVRLGEKSGRDILRVRELLELGAMEECFDSITEHDLALVRQHLDDAAENLSNRDLWDMWEYNMDFHCLLCSFDHNPYMEKHLRSCIAAEKRYYAQNHWREVKEFGRSYAPQPHEEIYAALVSRNRERTLRLLKQDIGVLG